MNQLMLRQLKKCTLAALLASAGWTPLSAQSVAVEANAPARRTAEGEALLARRVSVDLDRVTVREGIDALGKETRVRFLYRADVLDEIKRRVSLHLKEVPLRVALEQMLAGTNMRAELLTDNVVTIKPDMVRNADVGSVTGTVVDSKTRQPIVGATATLDGMKMAARTNEQGAFRLADIPPGSYTLVVRRLGYGVIRKAVTVTPNAAIPVDVTLSTTSTPLEDVVTTVTGPQRRLELGNVVSVIKADSLVKEAPITSISQLLTGRVPGLVVTQGQGTVGGNVKLQIRGQTSLSLSNEPIVIVDGVRYTSHVAKYFDNVEQVSPLNDINPNDIASVEVVKGASAATLYGTDAANGVIVITTKRGTAGPARWTGFVKTMSDVISDSRIPDYSWFGWMMTPASPYSCILDIQSRGFCRQDSVTKVPNPAKDREISFLQPARSWSYGASVSGGQSSLRYYFSGNYDDATGAVGLPPASVKALLASRGVRKLPEELMRPNTQSVLNLRSNVTAALGAKLDMSVNAGYVHGNTRALDNVLGSLTGAFAARPSQPYASNSWTPAALFARSSVEDNDRFVIGVNSQSRFVSWLSTRATLGQDVAVRNRVDLWPRDSTRPTMPNGQVQEVRNRQLATSADLGATVTLARGGLSTRTSVGGQYTRTLGDVLRSVGDNLRLGSSSIRFAERTSSYQDYNEAVTLGGYFEETLGLNDRLFVTGALRSDGASAFGTGYKAAVYPKASVSWLASQEPFMPHLPGLDALRLRAALGASGRQPASTWAQPSYDMVWALPEAGYGQPIGLAELGNPKLQPERVREFETGLDATALDQRIQADLTWYRRRTTDQILWQSLGPGLGGASTNLGLTRENGFEAQLSATLLDTRPVHWQVSLQHSARNTKLVNLGDATALYSEDGGYVEGYPLGARFMKPLLAFSDANGDGIIARSEVQLGDSMVYAGQTVPPRQQTLNTTVGFWEGRVRFSALFERRTGSTRINKSACDVGGCRAAVDRTAPLIDQARYIASLKGGYRYAESSDFTRLREVTAAVNLPSRLLQALRVTSGSVSLSARNLALWTKYSGVDPEAEPQYGFDGFGTNPSASLPLNRTWSLRFDLGL